jgi:hypothetical protein
MTSFTFTAEQIRSAPPEVRRWIENQIIAALAQARPEHMPEPAHAAALSACSFEEAAQVLELIKGNFLLTQVFFELGREMPGSRAAAPMHALDVGDLLRHTRVPDGDRLADCLTAINQAFQQVRSDPEASLFGFDERGHVYIHQATFAAVRRLWQQLVAAPGQASEPAEAAAPAAFSLPQLGPSEAVAGHSPTPGNFRF